QAVNHHVRIVMHVDNHVTDPKFAQAGKRNFKQSTSANFNQSFRAVISERTQPRAQASSQHHGLHWPIFSSSIFSNSTWRSTTSTPALPRKCLASCSARYTERCWPPVQPKEAVRLLKPR